MHDAMLIALLRHGEQLAQTEAERKIYELCQKDIERHLAYFVDHMRYLMLREPDRREEVHRYLNKAEWYLAKDGDDTLYSALGVIMGDGREGAAEAMADVAELRREQVETYLGYLRECHLGDREDRLNEELRKWAGIMPAEEVEKIPI